MTQQLPKHHVFSPDLAARIRALQANESEAPVSVESDLKVLSYVYVQLICSLTGQSQVCPEGGSDGPVQGLAREECGGPPGEGAPRGGTASVASSEGAGHPGVAPLGFDLSRWLDPAGATAGEF